MRATSALACVAVLAVALCVSGAAANHVPFQITDNLGNVWAVQSAANIAANTGLKVNTQQATQQNAGNGNGNSNTQIQNGRKLQTFTFPSIKNIGNVAAVQEAANVAANTGYKVNTQQVTQQNAGNGNSNSNTQIQNGRKLQSFSLTKVKNIGDVAAVQAAANLAGNTGLWVNTQQVTQQNAGNGNGNINGQIQNGRKLLGSPLPTSFTDNFGNTYVIQTGVNVGVNLGDGSIQQAIQQNAGNGNTNLNDQLAQKLPKWG